VPDADRTQLAELRGLIESKVGVKLVDDAKPCAARESRTIESTPQQD